MVYLATATALVNSLDDDAVCDMINFDFNIKMYDVDQAINGVTHVFISHIHKDHCDYNLMKHFPKTTAFYIPNIFPNDKIKKRV